MGTLDTLSTRERSQAIFENNFKSGTASTAFNRSKCLIHTTLFLCIRENVKIFFEILYGKTPINFNTPTGSLSYDCL